MRKHYRVLEINTNYIMAQPLDGVRPERISIGNPKKYIENELIVVSQTLDLQGRRRVLGSSMDPSYIADSRPRLIARDRGTFEIEEILHVSDSESFQRALEAYEKGDRKASLEGWHHLLSTLPLHIDCYYHLGLIASDMGRHARAAKYFEMAYRIGLRAQPEGFDGMLPWEWAGNRPFLRAAHSHALSLDRSKRTIEASEIYEAILIWDPEDRRGIRHLLPSFYLRARAYSKAESVLRTHGTDGVNQYTKSLIEIEKGQLDEGLRWFCYGVAYNPYLPDLLLGSVIPPGPKGTTRRVGRAGGIKEAGVYAREMGSWWRKEKPWAFLENLVRHGPLRQRIDRAMELRLVLDGSRVSGAIRGSGRGDDRIELVVQLGKLFGNASIPEILEECRRHW